MSDIDPIDSTPAAPALPAPASQRSVAAPVTRRSGGLIWVLLIGIVAIAAFGYWRLQTIEQGHDQSAQSEQVAIAKLRDQIEELRRGSEATQQETTALRARQDDAAKVNDSLRGQVIGLSERARLAEDAIANLADKRLSGHDALLLNEAELLLVLAGERYTLFADPAPALAAYNLADGAIAQANDAAFATVRQSIGAEIESLKAVQAMQVPALQSRLAELRQGLARMPLTSAPRVDDSDSTRSRWWQIFGQFIRVRRDSEIQGQLAHNDPLLARALLDADLRDAQAALLLRDETRLHAAAVTARTRLVASFDLQNSEAIKAKALLDELASAAIAPPAPTNLGSALKELRNLRATHALRQTVPTVPPKPVPTQPEGQS